MATLHLTLREPTHVASTIRSDQFRDTLTYVPGWVVRGAYAAAWLKRNGPLAGNPKRHEFIELFEGGVRFGPATAGPVISRSVYEHKYASSPTCQTKTVDAALMTTGNTPRKCEDCHQEWTPKSVSWHVATTVRTSVSIDPTTQTAAKGMLFSRARIMPTTLSGEVLGDLDQIRILETFGSLRVGGRLGTHGGATATLKESALVDDEAALRPDGALVIRLASPAVFVDDTGRPTLTPDREEISAIVGVGVTSIASWARWGSVGGWHAASGLPKPVETVALEGSTYAVQLDGRPTREALATLRRRGLGLRRHEGFGHIAPPLTAQDSGNDQGLGV